jgi:UDP-glucose 4-epimerase
VDIFGTDYPTPDGTCIRDYIHVDDLASAHILALEKIMPGSALAYNVGIGRGYTVREVIETARVVTGKPIAVQEAQRRPGDPPVLVANAEKVRRELGWSPHYTDLRTIIETAWNWHKSHPAGFGDRA